MYSKLVKRIINKVLVLFILLCVAGQLCASPFEMPAVSMRSVNTQLSSLNTQHSTLHTASADRQNSQHLPALSISRENTDLYNPNTSAENSMCGGPRRVAPGGGGSGTGVVPNPIGDTPWLLTLIMLLAYVLKKRLFRKA